MTSLKFLSAAALTLALALGCGTNASAQSSGGTALGYATYAMQYAQAADQPATQTHQTDRGYFYAYYAYYYAYYGYYSNMSYFGFTYGLASAAHDYSVDEYNNSGNVNSYYAQYYSSLASDNAYTAFFGQ